MVAHKSHRSDWARRSWLFVNQRKLRDRQETGSNKCIATSKKCHASSNKCLTTSNKKLTSNKCHATRNRCLTSSNKKSIGSQGPSWEVFRLQIHPHAAAIVDPHPLRSLSESAQ